MNARILLRRYVRGDRDFRGIALRGADLCEAKLSGTHFEDADLSGSRFCGADLSRCRLDGAILKPGRRPESVSHIPAGTDISRRGKMTEELLTEISRMKGKRDME
jgi:hypothetical protein